MRSSVACRSGCASAASSVDATPGPETQRRLERGLRELVFGEYLDVPPGRWLVWHGRGPLGPTRYACARAPRRPRGLRARALRHDRPHPWKMPPYATTPPLARHREGDRARAGSRRCRSGACRRSARRGGPRHPAAYSGGHASSIPAAKWRRSSSSSRRSARSRGQWARSASATRSTRCSRWSATCWRWPRCSCCCGRSSSPPRRSIVYAGAVMVLYVFVVAYVGEGPSEPLRPHGGRHAALGLAAVRAARCCVELCIAILGSGIAGARRARAPATFAEFGTPAADRRAVPDQVPAGVRARLAAAADRGGRRGDPRAPARRDRRGRPGGHLGRRRLPRARADRRAARGRGGDDGRGRRDRGAACREHRVVPRRLGDRVLHRR